MKLIRIRILIGAILFFSFLPATAQDEEPDSVYTAVVDSTEVGLRHFSEQKLEELKNDAELDYGSGPAAMSLWERFKRWLASLFESILDATLNTNWFEVVIMITMVAGLIYVILRLLKIDALKMFYGNKGAAVRTEMFVENIHEMDFETLLAEAVRHNDYRLAIRLLFLQSLKILADKQLIQWQPGKTNHDYLDELKQLEIKTGFNELNYYFEYAWYGNFHIAPELFGKVKDVFNNWRNRV